MLQDIITELTKPEYSSLNDVDALALIKGSPEFIQGMSLSGDVGAYLAGINKYKTLKEIALITDADTENPLYALRNGADMSVDTIINRTGFDWDIALNHTMLQGFVSFGVITEAQRLGILALGQSPKFEHCTLRQIRQARGKTNIQNLTGWKANGAIKLTVTGELFESVRPTVTKTNDLYTDEPLGRTVNVSSNGVHIIDLTGLRTLGNSADLTIELGAPNTFTVELI